ncbi:hypothetical protein COC42_15400 [Sphingomonas spermidinifaciens]|uniref:Uncharacterized protein n=1 Tax=Sphingomonas spermidinifaciens TaxID=1141889 RepID=A0A2A4B0C7_9SPHN|nr:hypothetical protein COC42_15400 [Sphingomonas spermidinifaciens]
MLTRDERLPLALEFQVVFAPRCACGASFALRLAMSQEQQCGRNRRGSGEQDHFYRHELHPRATI